MNIGVFLTFDYSLKTLVDSGILKRELKIYQEIHNKFGVNFTIFSYGDYADEQLVPVDSGISILPMYTFIRRNNNKYFRVLKSILLPFMLKEKIKDLDILHQHQLNGVWIPLICKWLYNKPLYMRTGYDTYAFSLRNSNKKMVQIFNKLLTTLSLKFSEIYTVTSKADLSFLSSNFSFNVNKIVVRPNWVDIKETKKRPISKNKILSVGRLVEQKNFSLLIKEMKNLSKETVLDIVGTGPLETELRDLSIQEGVAVNFLGLLDHEDLKNLYNNYTFYVSTASFEGNPKTVLEAMASGCVVFASDIESHRELIIDNFNGLLIDKNKPNLSEVINKVLSNQNNVSFYSTNAIESIKKNNSLDKIAKDTYMDYLQLI